MWLATLASLRDRRRRRRPLRLATSAKSSELPHPMAFQWLATSWPQASRCASLALAPLPLIFSYTSEKSLCDTGRPRVAVEVLPRWCAPLDAELWLLRSGSFCLWQASLRCGSLLTAARCAVVPPPLPPLAISLTCNRMCNLMSHYHSNTRFILANRHNPCIKSHFTATHTPCIYVVILN